MGLNWLSALVLLSGITPKLLVFGEGETKGLNLCDGSFRSELLLPSEQTFSWHITQVATVPWVYSASVWKGDSEETWLLDGEIARALKAVIKGAVVEWTSWSWLCIHAEHVRFCWKRRAWLRSTITVHTTEVWVHDFTMMWGAAGPAHCWALALQSKHVQYAHHPARWNSFVLIF